MNETLCCDNTCHYCDVNNLKCLHPFTEIDHERNCKSYKRMPDGVWGGHSLNFWLFDERNGNPCRRLVKGRIFIVCNEIFYTLQDYRYNTENIYLIDPRTGRPLGSVEQVEKSIFETRERLAKLPDIMTYPEVKDEP